MRLAIISDIHCGRRMYRTDENGFNKYEQLGYSALTKNMEIIKAENPDLVINAGDIFDTANPSVLAINQYFKACQLLNDIPTMTILGNHDFAFNNRTNKCSAAAIVNHTYFADYEIKSVVINDILFVMMPYIYDTNENIDKYLNQCKDITQNATNTKKILVTHGVTEKYYKDSLISDKLMLSDELVSLFDLVIIGHIHTPFNYKQGNSLVISPGAVIDYQSYTDRTGPIILDTDDFSFKKILVKTPHIIKKSCTEDDINNVLSSVTEDIYHITFDGNPEFIDNDLFIEAKNKTVALTIDVVEHKEEKTAIEKTHSVNIYAWIKNNYPDYVNIFNHAKEALSQK